MVFDIVFDNGHGIYSPGDEVKGIAKYSCNSEKRVRGVKIKLTGAAHTQWTTTERYHSGGETKTRRITVSGHEDYLNNKYYLAGSESTEITIPSGVTTYPFRFMLPHHIPSSFMGKYGNIRYRVKLVLDKAWAIDETQELDFTVVTPLDLNADYQLNQPQNVEFHKTFCCFCCASGPLYIIVKIPVSGYVPGQSIPILAECDNASNVNVSNLLITLRRKEYFMARTPKNESRTETQDLAQVQLGGCPADGSQNWSTKVDVPLQPPSNLSNCGIINVTYDLHISAVVSGPHTNLTRNIDITIGTIPLTSFNGPVGAVAVPVNVVQHSQVQENAFQQPPPLVGLGWNMANPNPPSGPPSMPQLHSVVYPPVLPPGAAPQMPPLIHQPAYPTPFAGLPSAPQAVDGLPPYPAYSSAPVPDTKDELPPPTYNDSLKMNSSLPPGVSPSAPPLN